MLSFSGGKDSLCCWEVLRELGVKVVPFYMALVPSLEFIDRGLDRAEQHFGEHIYRVIHPTFFHMLRTMTAQPWHRAELLDWINLPRFDYEDIEDGVRRTANAPAAWTVVGTRVSDSPLRRARIKNWRNENSRKIYAIWKFTKHDVVATLKRHATPVPPDYRLFGRSFDGIEYRYLEQIRKEYPKDFETILHWFPLHRAELLRAQWGAKHGQATIVSES